MVEGRTNRDRLESRLERAERKNRPDVAREIASQLETPPFPIALSYLWVAYARLRGRKAGGINGVEPIGWADIDAYCRLAGMRFVPWEIALIEELDDAYVAAMHADDGGDAKQAVKDSLSNVSKRTVVSRRP